MTIPTEVTRSLEALAENAWRLLNDAELVFRHGSHQTAPSLAILAIEEVGKFFDVRWRHDEKPDKPQKRPPMPKGWQAHRFKQGVASTLEAAEVAIGTIHKILIMKGVAPTAKNVQIFVEELHGDDEASKAEYDKVVELMVSNLHDHHQNGMGMLVQTGKIDAAKQRGFYVDIDIGGQITNGPSDITREEAEAWMTRARRCVRHMPFAFWPADIKAFMLTNQSSVPSQGSDTQTHAPAAS